MFTRNFWADLIERAVRASAWAVTALLGVDGSGAIHGPISWSAVGQVAGYAAGASVLVSLVGSQVGAKDSGSLLPADVDPPQEAPAAPAKKTARRKN
jgi:hypothetical protein